MARAKVAFVSSPYLGWKTVRQRWDRALGESPDLDYLPLHWEAYAKSSFRLYQKTGRLQSLWFCLAARAASKEAIRRGCDRILLTTIHAAALLPRRKGVRYLVYGDATPGQVERLYGGNARRGADERLYARMRRYGPEVAHLCMSRWYQEGLAEEFGVAPEATVLLPPAVRTDLWTPAVASQPSEAGGRPYVVFVGGDFKRKGGDLLQAVAPRFRDELDFVYVTGHEGAPGPNERFVKGLKADTPELVAQVAGAWLAALPTRADASPNAIVEAASAGIPVVATRVGGVAELVEDGVTGTVLGQAEPDALEAALRSYLDDPARRTAQAHAARARAAALYDVEAQLRRLREVLLG